MVTIDSFFAQLETLLYCTIVPEDAADESMFMSMEWDSETYWFKIGLPDDWFEPTEDEISGFFLHEDEDETEDFKPEAHPYTHPIRALGTSCRVKEKK